MSDVVVLSALGAIRIYGGGIFIFIVCRTSVLHDFHKKVVDITSKRSDLKDLVAILSSAQNGGYHHSKSWDFNNPTCSMTSSKTIISIILLTQWCAYI